MFNYRFLFLSFFIALTNNTSAQPDSTTLKLAVSQFNEYLLKRDTSKLKTLITNTLTYGHSNSWIQNSRTLLRDLYNGKLAYTVINQEILEITYEKNTASVRANAAVEGLVDGTPFSMKLHILQVWMDTGKKGSAANIYFGKETTMASVFAVAVYDSESEFSKFC